MADDTSALYRQRVCWRLRYIGANAPKRRVVKNVRGERCSSRCRARSRENAITGTYLNYCFETLPWKAFPYFCHYTFHHIVFDRCIYLFLIRPINDSLLISSRLQSSIEIYNQLIIIFDTFVSMSGMHRY